MWPVLMSVGPIVIRTLNVCLSVALLSGLFVFWRKGREEHYDEAMLFDGLLLSVVVGLVVGRIGLIVLNWSQFGMNWITWFDFISRPGFSLWLMLIASGWYLYRYAHRHKWDEFEILDFWVLAVSLALAWVWLGNFLGGVAVGRPTNLPWGVNFPGVFDSRHPVQLYLALFYVGLFSYLSWAEQHYRTFNWYRAGRNTAQTGFLVSVFLIATGLSIITASWLSVSTSEWGGWQLDSGAGLMMLIAGLITFYWRSGRELPGWRRKTAQTKLAEFETETQQSNQSPPE